MTTISPDVVAAWVNSPEFLQSYHWRRVRMEILKERGARCDACGATRADGVVMNVDHIRPRRTHPELALDKANLQVLCGPCNHGKGSWDDTDWRGLSGPVPLPCPACGKRFPAEPHAEKCDVFPDWYYEAVSVSLWGDAAVTLADVIAHLLAIGVPSNQLAQMILKSESVDGFRERLADDTVVRQLLGV